MKNIKCNLLILRFLLPNRYIKVFLDIVLLISINGIFAQTSGSLDLSFGGTGIVITDVAGGNDVSRSVAIQTDGKIVVAGTSDYDFAVVRYNTDGTLDSTFGTGGKVITPVGSIWDFASAIAIQTDGKIVVAGSSNNGSDYDFALVRYNTDGTLDTTFGTSGKVITPVGNSYDDEAYAVAIQTNGKIVAAGSGYSGSGPFFENELVRYNTDGTLDTTFGTGGKVITIVRDGSKASSVTIQTDGKIVVAGESVSGTNYDFAVVRYNTNGTLDATFGTGGKVIIDIGSDHDYAYAVVTQDDGKIIAIGYTNVPNCYFAVVRCNTDGILDTTFGTGGKVITPVGSIDDRARTGVIQTDGKIVVAGYSDNGSNNDFAVVRYNTNGTLDNTFGTDGIVITAIGDFRDEASAVAIQTDGKIVAVGYSYNNGSNNDFVVVRYIGVVNNIPEIKESDNFVVFPNPTDNSFFIEAYIAADNHGIIKIYDLKGELLKELVLKKGSNKTMVHTSGWRKGIYICNLIINGKIIKSEKMVLAR